MGKKSLERSRVSMQTLAKACSRVLTSSSACRLLGGVQGEEGRAGGGGQETGHLVRWGQVR